MSTATAEIQPSLFDQWVIFEPEPPLDGHKPTIQERFAAFHAANPHVYHAICKLARQMMRAGHSHWSTKGAFEVMRWQWALTTNDPSGFKLNNIYTAPYARLIMANEPDLAGFFETRGDKDGDSLSQVD